MFTDIKGSTLKWSKNSEVMAKSIVCQNIIFEECLDYIQKYCGKKLCIKTNEIGDAWQLTIHVVDLFTTFPQKIFGSHLRSNWRKLFRFH